MVGIGSPMQAFRLSERRLPTKRELDAAVPENPAYVTFGAHIPVANSSAVDRPEGYPREPYNGGRQDHPRDSRSAVLSGSRRTSHAIMVLISNRMMSGMASAI